MQKEKLAAIGLAIIIIVALSGYFLVDENIRNAIFENLFGEEKKEDKLPPVGGAITYGDSVEVNYTGKFLNGTVFDTNNEEVAKQWDLYNESVTYEPSKVFIDPNFEFEPPEGYENYSADFITGFLEGLIGMKEGEKKNVTIPPEEGYGIWNESLAEMLGMGSVPIDSTDNKTQIVNKTQFEQSFPEVNLTVNTTFDYGVVISEKAGIINGTITEITDENVTFTLFFENGTTITVPTLWTITFTHVNDTHYNIRQNLEVGQKFTLEYGYDKLHLKVIDSNETHARFALNFEAPEVKFIGETLIFELEIVKVYKTSALLES